jgi:hypothetical protein
MFRRVLMAVSFVAALGVAGFVATDSAEAHGRRGWHHGHGHGHGPRYYGAYYGGGYGGYYPPVGVVRSAYYPPIYYGAPVYYGGYGGGCGYGNGLTFSVGF